MLNFKGLTREEVGPYFLANASKEELQTAIDHSKKILETLGETESFTARAHIYNIQGYEAALVQRLNADWNPLVILNESEVSIATEFGDGTQFKVGETVSHNHILGRYRRVS